VSCLGSRLDLSRAACWPSLAPCRNHRHEPGPSIRRVARSDHRRAGKRADRFLITSRGRVASQPQGKWNQGRCQREHPQRARDGLHRSPHLVARRLALGH
jgi:hypothetical protein